MKSNRGWVSGCAALALAGVLSGCSMIGTGISVAKNLGSNKLELRIFLDDQEAKRDELKQAATGYSRYKVKEPINTAPKLRFEYKKPDALGRITMVTTSIHQKFEADYSHHAEFTVVTNSNDPEAQMKPNTTYDLGAMPSGFRIIDYKGGDVPAVALKPGMEYMLTLTVKADASESAQIYFKTK